MKVHIETRRLLLREWEPTDLEPFAALNADPRVMEFFPSRLSAEQTRQFYERIVGEFDHPALPPDDWLCRHVLYEKRLAASE